MTYKSTHCAFKKHKWGLLAHSKRDIIVFHSELYIIYPNGEVSVISHNYT